MTKEPHEGVGWQRSARRKMHSARLILQRAGERHVLNWPTRDIEKKGIFSFRASGFALALTWWMYDAPLAEYSLPLLLTPPLSTAGAHKLFGLTAAVLDFICANLRYELCRGWRCKEVRVDNLSLRFCLYTSRGEVACAFKVHSDLPSFNLFQRDESDASYALAGR